MSKTEDRDEMENANLRGKNGETMIIKNHLLYWCQIIRWRLYLNKKSSVNKTQKKWLEKDRRYYEENKER